jgi:hypothetical protein
VPRLVATLTEAANIEQAVLDIRARIERGDCELASRFVPDFNQAVENFKEWRLNAVNDLMERWDEIQASDEVPTDADGVPISERSALDFDAQLAKKIAALGKETFGSTGAGGGRQGIKVFLDFDV